MDGGPSNVAAHVVRERRRTLHRQTWMKFCPCRLLAQALNENQLDTIFVRCADVLKV